MGVLAAREDIAYRDRTRYANTVCYIAYIFLTQIH